MANRCALTNQIELLSGPLSAQTYFDANWNNPVTALNDASLGYVNGIATDTGSANNYIVSTVFGVPSAYNPGMSIDFIPANTNTGPSTITVNGLSAQSIFDMAGNALTPGLIQAGMRTNLTYISGAFRLPYLYLPGTLNSNQQNTAGGSTTLTVNCGGYAHVNLAIDTQGGPSGNTTVLLLTNVAKGAHFDLQWQPFGVAQTLKFSNACTDYSGATIGKISVSIPTGGSTDLIVAGFSGVSTVLVATGSHFFDSSAGAGAQHNIRFTYGFN